MSWPYNRAVLIVEGYTDARVIGRFLDCSGWQIRVADGKTNLVTAIQQLIKRGKRRVAGLADADFDRLMGIHPPAAVFFTDHHDLEVMMLHSDAIVGVFSRFGIDADRCSELRRAVMAAASRIGLLRLANTIHRLNMTFDGIERDLGEFVDTMLTTVNDAALIHWAVENNQTNALVSPSRLTMLIRSLATQPYRETELVRGHDACALLSYYLCFHRQANVSCADLEAHVSDSYTASAFSATGVCRELTRWARSNQLPDLWKAGISVECAGEALE